MNAPCVRMMEEKDLREVSVLERDVFADPWTMDSLGDSLLEDTIFLVYEKFDEIAGYVGMYYSFDEGAITRVCVKQKYRRQKIADSMLRKLFALSVERGVEKIFLEVRVSNIPALNLYTRCGFNTIGKRPRFYSHPSEDAYIMRKSLI